MVLKGTADEFTFDEPELQFDPQKVRSLISNTSVPQWIPPNMLLLRLMGTKIVAQTQIETTGTNLLDVLYPPQRETTKRTPRPIKITWPSYN